MQDRSPPTPDVLLRCREWSKRATSSLLVCALPISASGYKETSARKMAAAGHRLDRAASGSSEQELILRTLISKRKSGP